MSRNDCESASLRKVRQALEYLVASHPEIIWFYMSIQNGELDRPPLRTDVLIGLRSRLSITLQVKSREEDAAKFRQENPFKPAMAVKKSDTMMDVANAIMDIVRESYRYIANLRGSPI